MWPQHRHQADGDERVGQVFADEIEPEDVERERQDDDDQDGDQRKADQFEAARIVADGGKGGHRVVTF